MVEQKGRCKYCKRRLARAKATRDHRIPRAKGGRDDRANINAACGPCNVAKGSLDERLFMRMLRGQVPALHWGIKVQAMVRRINTQTDRACARILKRVGVAA